MNSTKLSDEKLKQKFKELPKKSFLHNESTYYLVQTWAIYLDSTLFEATVFRLKELIEKDIGLDNFDYICAVPPCGVPISTGVSLYTGKPLIVPFPPEFRFMVPDDFYSEDTIERGKRILLIDGIINSGASARATKDKLESIDGKFVGLVIAIFNDTFPERKSDKFKKDEVNNIKYLFNQSEL